MGKCVSATTKLDIIWNFKFHMNHKFQILNVIKVRGYHCIKATEVEQ